MATPSVLKAEHPRTRGVIARTLFAVLALTMFGIPVVGSVGVGGVEQVSAAPLLDPNDPANTAKYPHYFGPYPNWANSPQVLANAVVTINPAPPVPVSVGNQLIDRAYATDYATGPGTLGPVFVVLPNALLPNGTLQSFETRNQAFGGLSPWPSAGGLLHAYVLRPTGTAGQYQVVYDSGLLTIPALTNAGTSEVASFPTGGVAVQAGDVIGFYGQGVPITVGGGADILSYPASTPPAQDAVLTLGVDPGFPILTQDRTYSFAATVLPAATDPGAGAEATATVDPKTGGISAITVTSPGSGYILPPMVEITSPGIVPTAAATAHSEISLGVISSVTVVESGFGFRQPQVSVTGGNPTTPATLVASGGVDNVTLLDGGSGYTLQPIVEFSLPNLPGGVQAEGVATMDANGVVDSIAVLNPGSGYTQAPSVTIWDGSSKLTPPAFAQAAATIGIAQIDVTSGGEGYDSAPTVSILDVGGVDRFASATANVSIKGAVTNIVIDNPGSGYLTPGLRKFVDTLPGLTAAGANNLGQYIPIAVADTTTYPGTDYYEIALVQYRMKFHTDLPPTLLRGYVQLSTSVTRTMTDAQGNFVDRQIPLTNAKLDPALPAAPALLPDGITQAVGVDNPHYLGPTIVATKDRPVRILFRNLLPTNANGSTDGNLFMPVDTSLMGAGLGPDAMTLDANGVPIDMTADQSSVLDGIRNPECGALPKPSFCFSENRATLHLHGGITPWISDGTPHQWTTPAGENTNYPQGVSVSNVPDMPDPGPGALTFFYTNQQSARLMFYHDHAWGITRLNVYAGEAAGYLITDATEKSLFTDPGAPFEDLGLGTPLIVQDKTFVPSAAKMAMLDPTWNYTRWGGEGNLWVAHVYMPAQNPGDPSGMSEFGRWMYGPWFWPPAKDAEYPPIPNPYYDAACDPNVQPFCEPALIPSTPNVSVGMEQFNDTPVVNGTAYPKTTVDPKTYRFRILNAANDRFWNLSWYVADPRTGTLSEVALKPAELEAAQTDPVVFPTPDTTWSPKGPSWIQIGTEGGFLPTPVVVPAHETTWITDPTRFDVGNVDQHSLLLAPAERADVIVDFSQFRGKTLILYNDAPAAFPARVPGYDYYTGGPDLSPAGAPTTLPGYGPNTRTIMQVKVSSAAPAVAFDRPGTTADRMGTLMAEFAHQADGSGVFESGSNPIIVGQAVYNQAYGTQFAASGWCSAPTNPTAKCDGYARISEGSHPTDTFKFDTLSGPQLQIPFQPKGIHDEMNSANFDEWGRMSANLGLEAPGATPLTQNIILYPYVNPATELLDSTQMPSSLDVTPISSAADGTQIWKVTHNGVDTHPIHFHLYDVQVLNRVAWDNIITPPDPTELGWKDTVRMNPLQDTYIALRPIVPTLPFAVPDSKRPLNPMMPIGARGSQNGVNGNEAGFNNTNTLGQPIAPIVNLVTDFGWEYVFHCHILSHEEMDMMRPVNVEVSWEAPPPVTNLTATPGSVILQWTDPTPVNYLNPASWGNPTPGKGGTNPQYEVGFRIERRDAIGGAWEQIGIAPANSETYTDNPPNPTSTHYYRVITFNESASAAPSNVVAMLGVPAGPTNLIAQVVPNATLPAGAEVALSWANVATDADNVIVERADGAAGTFNVLATLPGTSASFVDQTVLLPGDYTYQVRAVNTIGSSAPAGPVAVTVPKPATTTVVVGAPNPALVGETVTFTATVTSANAPGTPTGTVTFSIGALSVPVALDAAGVATYATALLPLGQTTVTADYGGDAIFAASSGSAQSQSVTPGTTSTAVSSSLNPSVYGDQVTFTATVTKAGGAATPSGTVEFWDGATSLGSVPVQADATATFATSSLTGGSHSILATYSGDGFFTGSSGSMTQVVNQAATSTALVSNPTTSAEGELVTLTATVSPAAASGAVQFFDGATLLGSGVLSGGVATLPTSFSVFGAHTITAVYGGDGNFLGSTSPPITQTVLRATTTVITSNRVPSANLGQNITFTATVRPVTGTGFPALGTVEFRDNGTLLGNGVYVGNGRWTFSTTTLMAGSHPITAQFLGSGNFAASMGSYVQVVNQRATITTVTSSVNPSVFGQDVTFTGRVQPYPGPGSIVFSIDGGAGVALPMDATGRARLSTTSLAVGAHTITATYLGSVNYSSSSSAPFTQTVNKSSSIALIATSGTPALFGSDVTFTVTVTAAGNGAGLPSGGVEIRVDGVPIGTPTLTLGQATLTTNTIPRGRHVISATYLGDGNFNPDASNTFTQRII